MTGYPPSNFLKHAPVPPPSILPILSFIWEKSEPPFWKKPPKTQTFSLGGGRVPTLEGRSLCISQGGYIGNEQSQQALNAGKNLYNQSQPYNTLNNIIPYNHYIMSIF